MEPKGSEIEKNKNDALGEIQEKTPPIYRESGGKKPVMKIENAHPGSYERTIIE